jgi:trans-2-enoyl-CoA reductase
MCYQTEVLNKVHAAGKVNGYAMELAEAQAKDYVMMNKKVARIEKDVSSIKKEQKAQREMLARQGGQLDVVVQYIKSPAEEERKNGVVWSEIKKIINSPLGKTIILLFIFCLGLAGQRIMELSGVIK